MIGGPYINAPAVPAAALEAPLQWPQSPALFPIA
jgi:hypothetical protein